MKNYDTNQKKKKTLEHAISKFLKLKSRVYFRLKNIFKNPL